MVEAKISEEDIRCYIFLDFSSEVTMKEIISHLCFSMPEFLKKTLETANLVRKKKKSSEKINHMFSFLFEDLMENYQKFCVRSKANKTASKSLEEEKLMLTSKQDQEKVIREMEANVQKFVEENLKLATSKQDQEKVILKLKANMQKLVEENLNLRTSKQDQEKVICEMKANMQKLLEENLKLTTLKQEQERIMSEMETMKQKAFEENLLQQEEIKNLKKTLDQLRDNNANLQVQKEYIFKIEKEALRVIDLKNQHEKDETEIVELYKENKQLHQGKEKIYEEMKQLYQEKDKFQKEIAKLHHALLSTYDEYAGLTSRRILDKFFDFFLEEHRTLGCSEHESLYTNLEKNIFDKLQVIDHWNSCNKLAPARKNILTSFVERIKNINTFLNRYIHRNNVFEIVIPSDCQTSIIYEIYDLFKIKIKENLNNGEDMKMIKIDWHGNFEEQIKQFYFYANTD